MQVSGPPQGFVLTSQLNTNWSQTYRYTLSWAGDQYNSSFAGGVNVSIDATQSGCGLYINTCSLGGINYGAINSTGACVVGEGGEAVGLLLLFVASSLRIFAISL